ncbi:MAG: Gfo/Idh/MocA family protein, partial [Candidatus Hodarchaeota archaeon]
ADHFSVVEEIIDLRTSSLKAIAIEKPVTSSLVDAYRLQRLLNEIGLKTLIGHSEIYNPAVQKLFEILSSQVIGIPKIFLFQRRSNVPNEKLPFLGDIFEDLAIHDFDLFSRIITKNELQIQCKGFYYDNILNSAIVQIHAIQNDISALFLFSRNFTGKIRQIEIEAINGTIFVELLDQYLIYNLRSQIKASMQSISISSGEGEKIKVYGEPLLEEHLDFHALLKEEKVTPLVSIKDAIRALSIVEACRKSAELDKSIKLNIESL